METVAVILGIILILYIGRIFVRKLNSRSHDIKGLGNIKQHLEGLLFAYTLNGYIIIKHKPSKKFLQFNKEMNDGEEVLALWVPEAPWSYQDFDKLIDICDENKFDYVLEETGEETVKRFLVVKPLRSVDLAIKIIGLFFAALRVNQQERFLITYGGNTRSHKQGVARAKIAKTNE